MRKEITNASDFKVAIRNARSKQIRECEAYSLECHHANCSKDCIRLLTYKVPQHKEHLERKPRRTDGILFGKKGLYYPHHKW
jgi:hypothetical protein